MNIIIIDVSFLVRLVVCPKVEPLSVATFFSELTCMALEILLSLHCAILFSFKTGLNLIIRRFSSWLAPT